MDWALATRRNRDALLAIVAAVVDLLGGREPGPITGRIRSAALALLRPAEAAARRLIVIAARGLAVPPRTASIFPSVPIGGAARGSRPPAFRLFDRAKRYTLKLPTLPPNGVPRIRTFWSPPPAQPVSPPPAPPSRYDLNAPVDAARLRLRLAALEYALADLPRQARRLARLRARRVAAARGSSSRTASPLRFGRPPGWRARPLHEVDQVLRDCHALALDALAPDTS